MIAIKWEGKSTLLIKSIHPSVHQKWVCLIDDYTTNVLFGLSLCHLCLTDINPMTAVNIISYFYSPHPPLLLLLINLLSHAFFHVCSYSPLGKRCIQKVVSCWWEQYRRRSVTSGWVECAESYQPETWSRRCCRQNTHRPPERGWQICPAEKQTKRERGVTKFVGAVDEATVCKW